MNKLWKFYLLLIFFFPWPHTVKAQVDYNFSIDQTFDVSSHGLIEDIILDPSHGFGYVMSHPVVGTYHLGKYRLSDFAEEAACTIVSTGIYNAMAINPSDGYLYVRIDESVGATGVLMLRKIRTSDLSVVGEMALPDPGFFGAVFVDPLQNVLYAVMRLNPGTQVLKIPLSDFSVITATLTFSQDLMATAPDFEGHHLYFLLKDSPIPKIIEADLTSFTISREITFPFDPAVVYSMFVDSVHQLMIVLAIGDGFNDHFFHLSDFSIVTQLPVWAQHGLKDAQSNYAYLFTSNQVHKVNLKTFSDDSFLIFNGLMSAAPAYDDINGIAYIPTEALVRIIKLNISPLWKRLVDPTGGQVCWPRGTIGEVCLDVPLLSVSTSFDVTYHDVSSLPPDTSSDLKGTGLGFQLTTDPAVQLSLPLNLYMTYQNSEIGARDKTKFVLAAYDPNLLAWTALPSTSNSTLNMVSASIRSFTTFQLMTGTSTSTGLPPVITGPTASGRKFFPLKGQVASISYTSQGGTVETTIYNMLGEEVAHYQTDTTAGPQTFTWDGSGQPSGIYSVRIKTPSETQKYKVGLIR